MLSLCLLPGLDGTGHLYRALCERLPPTLAPAVLSYDSRHFESYAALADELAPRLPAQGDYVLVAESFAGPLAVMLAQRYPARLRALMLAASFVASPLPASGLLAGLIERLPAILPPGLLLEHLLAGWGADAWIRQAMDEVLSTIPHPVLQRRALAALRSDVRKALAELSVPVLCLVATRDRLIGRHASREIARWAQQVEVQDIDAPHFLFQTAPDAAVAAMMDFLHRRGMV